MVIRYDKDALDSGFRIVGVFEFVPLTHLTFRSSGKGEIAIRDKEGKEIGLDKLWGKYLPAQSLIYLANQSMWINLDIEIPDDDEKKDSDIVKEIVDKKINDKDNIDENISEDEILEMAFGSVKTITKTERGTLFLRPYRFIDRAGLGDNKLIIGYRSDFGVDDLISLSELLEMFIGDEVILTLKIEALDENISSLSFRSKFRYFK